MKEAEEDRRASADDRAVHGEFASGTGWYDVAAPAEGSSGLEAYDDRRQPDGISGPTQISRRPAGSARDSFDSAAGCRRVEQSNRPVRGSAVTRPGCAG
jgi:hypothetical protein